MWDRPLSDPLFTEAAAVLGLRLRRAVLSGDLAALCLHLGKPILGGVAHAGNYGGVGRRQIVRLGRVIGDAVELRFAR